MPEVVKTTNTQTNSNAVANQKSPSSSSSLAMPSVPISKAEGPEAENTLMLDDELLVLHGRSSSAANMFSFAHQNEFKNMQDAIEKYDKNPSPENLKSIEDFGQAWLDKRKEVKSLDEDDNKKKQSITKILERIRRNSGDAKINFLTMSNSETTGSAIFGNVSDFVKIQNAHYEFQEKMGGGIKSLDSLYIVLGSSKTVMDEIALWKGKHEASKDPSNVEKKTKIEKIERSLKSISGKFAVTSHFTVSIYGFDFTRSTDSNFFANSATATVNLFDKIISAELKDVNVSKEGLAFSNAKFSISELSLGNAKVTELVINLKDKTNKYAFAISGKSLELDCLGVLVKADTISYDSATNELTADVAEASTTISDQEIKGHVSKLKLGKNGATFETATIELSGLDLGLVKASELKAEISANKGDYAFVVSGKSATAEFMGVTIVGENISYDSAKNELTVTSAEAKTTIADQEVKGSLENIVLNKKGMSFEKAALEISGIDLGKIKAEELKAEVVASEGKYDLTVSGKSLTVEFMGVTVNGENILYDHSKHELSVVTAEAKVNILSQDIKGTVINIKLGKQGASFEKAKLEVPELSVGPIKAKELNGEITGAAGNYEFILMANTMTGDISLFNIAAEELRYNSEAKEFTANKTTVTGNPFGTEPIIGQVAGLKISKEGVDWETGNIGFNSTPFNFGGLNISLPNTAVFHGKNSGYLVEVKGAKGDLTIGEYLKADGAADFSWSKEKPVPEIDTANVKVNAPIVKNLPGDFVPGWPINVSVDFPIAPGAFVGFAFKFGGGFGVKILGEINYDKSAKKFSFSGGPEINGQLSLEIAVQAGAGHPLILSIQAFVAAKLEANAKGNLTLIGDAVKESEAFNFGPILAKYDIGAELLAKLKLGISATAFIVFNKEIYSVDIAEWDLGKAEKSGTLGLSNGEKGEGTSTGLLGDRNTALASIKSPFELKKSNYLKNLKTLVENIPKKDNTSADRQNITSYVDDDKIIKAEEAEVRFQMAKNVVDNTPKELMLRKSVLKELKTRKLGQIFIWEENRQKRLMQYADLEERIALLEKETVIIQSSIKESLTPESDNDIALQINDFIRKLDAMADSFSIADKYNTLGDIKE
jgi:hypothetical protein